MKFITFSFDDNVVDDIRLVEILNKYGLKGTFNLNSGTLSRISSWRYGDVKDVTYINYCEQPNLYDGHEVACHTYRHPHLEKLDRGTADNEVRLDKKILECLYGYQIRGMAYPYGTYNDEVLEVLRDNGIEYSRTVKSTHGFGFPEEPLLWNPTCHFRDAEVMKLAEKFLNSESEEDMLLYIWGHSYEMVTEEDWKAFEELCAYISGREDIRYCTNIEVLDYMSGKNHE